MKNRKTIIIAFLLIAAMVVGVGYAALTDTLTINGALEIDSQVVSTAFDLDVYFTNVQISTAYDDGSSVTLGEGAQLSASISANNNDQISFTANKMWRQVGQTVTIVATITNTGENVAKAAQLALSVEAESGQDYFEGVSKTFSTPASGKNVETDGLQPGESCTLTIIFECKELPTDTKTATVTYNLAATAVEPASN